MHTELFVLETGDGADPKLQSANQTHHPAAKSDRSRIRSLEHAALQRPGAARFSGCAQRRAEADRAAVDDRIAALCLCRSRFLFRTTRTRLQIFSARTSQNREVRRFSRSQAGNAERNFRISWRETVAERSRQRSKYCPVRASDDAGGTKISLRRFLLRDREARANAGLGLFGLEGMIGSAPAPGALSGILSFRANARNLP